MKVNIWLCMSQFDDGKYGKIGMSKLANALTQKLIDTWPDAQE